MRVIDRDQTERLLQWGPLVEALRDMFRKGCEMPVRHHHDMAVPGEQDATMLLMPAWASGEYIGVKIVNVFPGNADRGLPAISGNYLLSSGKTGEMLAIVDGGELTARRTAAASALAADYLARKDASSMLMVGTGRLSTNLVEAHRSVRPIEKVAIWGRNPDKAAQTVAELAEIGIEASVAADLEAAAGEADIVSCATLSTTPLVQGGWLKHGAHLDLVGGFRATMRETDDEAVKRATVFVDTRDGCLDAGEFCPGDIKDPVESGILDPATVADLYALTRGEADGRSSTQEITMFKSVGAALEDLAGAVLAYEAAG